MLRIKSDDSKTHKLDNPDLIQVHNTGEQICTMIVVSQLSQVLEEIELNDYSSRFERGLGCASTWRPRRCKQSALIRIWRTHGRAECGICFGFDEHECRDDCTAAQGGSASASSASLLLFSSLTKSSITTLACRTKILDV